MCNCEALRITRQGKMHRFMVKIKSARIWRTNTDTKDGPRWVVIVIQRVRVRLRDPDQAPGCPPASDSPTGFFS